MPVFIRLNCEGLGKFIDLIKAETLKIGYRIDEITLNYCFAL